VLIACNANIPIPKTEARIFKQHFENNILRPELSGNFQSTGFFRVAEAYVIDDATNKKYDLFDSKFVAYGNDIIYDNVTKLLWAKKPLNAGRKMKPKEARIACERLTIEGLAGWRLPTGKELTRMFSVYHNQERHPFGRLGEGCYLTNTECKGWKLRCVNLQKREDNNCCDGRDDWYWPVRGSE
jgi:Protein of unknown function (DUF1566)